MRKNGQFMITRALRAIRFPNMKALKTSRRLEHYGELDEAKKALEDHYAGEYESLSDFAQELTEQGATIPDNLAFYIDYEKMARDLEINDVLTIKTAYDQVHVFWAH